MMSNYSAIARGMHLDVDRIYIAIFAFWLFTLLCFVRKIAVFSSTHVFADIMILLTIIVVVVFGSIYWKDNGTNTGVDPINKATYTSSIGFSVYAFEGIGLILPVQDITENPKTYYKIVIAVIVSVAGMFVSFGLFCSFAWGDK
jgi:proton-coupled amino acid transporter